MNGHVELSVKLVLRSTLKNCHNAFDKFYLDKRMSIMNDFINIVFCLKQHELVMGGLFDFFSL